MVERLTRRLSRTAETPADHALREHLRITLPTFKVPKYITLTDRPLPRNASEKIHRLALRQRYVAK